MINTGAVILAAGRSSRLGRPKQFLEWKGISLLRKIIDTIKTAEFHPVVIVTGEWQKQTEEIVASAGLATIHNEHWEQGMGTSISAGLTHLVTNFPGLHQILIAVVDQPFVDANLLTQMTVLQKTTGKGIIACSYADTIGTPAIFSQAYFPALQTLSGDSGAKKIMQRAKDDLETISFPNGAIDIDTEEDYRSLESKL